jgi:hypothetical protein
MVESPVMKQEAVKSAVFAVTDLKAVFFIKSFEGNKKCRE